MTDTTSKTRATELDPSLVDQLNWAVAALGLGRVECGGETISIESHPAAIPAGATGNIAGAAIASSDSPAVLGDQAVAAASMATEIPCQSEPVVAWLRRARQAGQQSASGVWEAAPAGDPETIREIAGPLLSPFAIRQGHCRLAGCTLEKRPTLRLGRLVRGIDATGKPSLRVQWHYYAADGSRWDGETVGRRGWDRLRTTPKRLRASERSSIEAWIAAVAGDEPRLPAEDLIDVTVLWCRWASGKIIIQFDSGPTASIPFAAWASDYTRGGLQPSPFRCDRTGLESYQVIALDDGTVTVPQAVARCELTGHELLMESLATCEVSGLRVERERLVECQATGRLAIPERLLRCDWCNRRMIPDQIQRGRCEACRRLGPIAADDPRLQALRERNPQAVTELGSERGWSGWLAEDVGVILGGGVIKNRLLVFDPRHGMVTRRGSRRGLSRRWKIDTVADPID